MASQEDAPDTAAAQVPPAAEAEEPSPRAAETSVKVRRPYNLIKQRERWTDNEHALFLEALQKYGRAWRKIEEHIGTKTTVQIRSHAQKFFSKVDRERASGASAGTWPIVIPPPRPKRKSASHTAAAPKPTTSGQQQASGSFILHHVLHKRVQQLMVPGVDPALVSTVAACAATAATSAAAAVMSAAQQMQMLRLQQGHGLEGPSSQGQGGGHGSGLPPPLQYTSGPNAFAAAAYQNEGPQRQPQHSQPPHQQYYSHHQRPHQYYDGQPVHRQYYEEGDQGRYMHAAPRQDWDKVASRAAADASQSEIAHMQSLLNPWDQGSYYPAANAAAKKAQEAPMAPQQDWRYQRAVRTQHGGQMGAEAGVSSSSAPDAPGSDDESLAEGESEEHRGPPMHPHAGSPRQEGGRNTPNMHQRSHEGQHYAAPGGHPEHMPSSQAPAGLPPSGRILVPLDRPLKEHASMHMALQSSPLQASDPSLGHTNPSNVSTATHVLTTEGSVPTMMHPRHPMGGFPQAEGGPHLGPYGRTPSGGHPRGSDYMRASAMTWQPSDPAPRRVRRRPSDEEYGHPQHHSMHAYLRGPNDSADSQFGPGQYMDGQPVPRGPPSYPDPYNPGGDPFVPSREESLLGRVTSNSVPNPRRMEHQMGPIQPVAVHQALGLPPRQMGDPNAMQVPASRKGAVHIPSFNDRPQGFQPYNPGQAAHTAGSTRPPPSFQQSPMPDN